jgi:phosphopantothenoylcysteine decarboxylase / phosphopantothenate---cysteine ligase
LINKKILVTAGPTQEPIDPVRYIGNRSSGKMAYALASVFADLGARVLLVSGPVNITIKHRNITKIDVITAREMYEACLLHFPDSDAAVLAAAVADFTPLHPATQKIKKQEEEQVFVLKLKKTQDILATLGKMKKDKQILVGFSLETHNEIEFALRKRTSKNLDFIVMNSLRDEGAAFNSDTNKITIIDHKDQIHPYPLKSKAEVASDIAAFLMTYWQE